MSHVEEAVIRRYSGPRILMTGLVIAAAGVSPLLLYVIFGPKDGNPIGLGLLAVAAVPIGALVAAVGLIKTLVQLLAGRGG